jgi:hypothetical protein
MNTELKSEGKCVYCDKTFLQTGIVKHLKSHLAASERANASTGIAIHLSIVADKMFLQLLVNGSATFKELDGFLRDIWVDCCGHLSGFSYQHTKIAMRSRLQDVLTGNITIRYDYDFGDTTTFYCKVVGIYHLTMNEPLVLLSRNEPLKIKCSLCNKKPAVAICSVHMYEDEYLFCESCARKHEKVCEDFAGHARLPVINSPRMGVCGYTGGEIDLERDNAYGM